MSKKQRNSSTETPQRFYPLRDPDDPGKSRLVPITEEFYHAVYPGIWRKQKQMQKEGKCLCPRKQLWTCDGDCDVCPHFNNDLISLDTPVAGTEGNTTIGDNIADEKANFKEALMYAELLEALADEVDQLDYVEGNHEAIIAGDLRDGAKRDGSPGFREEPAQWYPHLLRQDKMRRLRQLVRLQTLAFQRCLQADDLAMQPEIQKRNPLQDSLPR